MLGDGGIVAWRWMALARGMRNDVSRSISPSSPLRASSLVVRVCLAVLALSSSVVAGGGRARAAVGVDRA